MFEKPFSVGTRGFRTVVSITNRSGNEEFVRKLTEEVRNDGRFLLHTAAAGYTYDELINLGLLVDYASHARPDMIVCINCNAAPDVRFESAGMTKPVVKVLSHHLTEVGSICRNSARINILTGREEQKVMKVLLELQRRMSNVSLDSVLKHLNELNLERANLTRRMKELRSCMKNSVIFVSVEVSPKDSYEVECQVNECLGLIHLLHDHYSRKDGLLLSGSVMSV